MATSKGNCFICGKTADKTAIRKHILKEHNTGDEPCYLLKIEGAHYKYYWLFIDAPKTAKLSVIDKFLREIWLECCGHLSRFSGDGEALGKAMPLGALHVGDVICHEYDFGTTTETLITVVSEISRPKQRAEVRLLTRNEPPVMPCAQCGKPATEVDAFEDQVLCEECAASADVEGLLPMTNSPRCGECGYAGEDDVWTFPPAKLIKSAVR